MESPLIRRTLPKKFQLAVIALATVSLIACGGGSGNSSNDGAGPDNVADTPKDTLTPDTSPTKSAPRTLSAGLPKVLIASFDSPSGSLQVEVVFDADTPAERRLSLNNVEITPDFAAVVGSVPGDVVAAASTVTVVYNFIDDVFGLIPIAQTASVTLDTPNDNDDISLIDPIITFFDTDGDQVINLVELQNGTDPSDPTSVPTSPTPVDISVALSAAGAVVTWDALPGAQSYGVFTVASVASQGTTTGVEWAYQETDSTTLILPNVGSQTAYDVLVMISGIVTVGEGAASSASSSSTVLIPQARNGHKPTLYINRTTTVEETYTWALSTEQFDASPAPPVLYQFTPCCDATANAPIDTTLSVTFNKAINPAPFTAHNTFNLRDDASGALIDGTIDVNHTTVTFSPLTPLAENTPYSVEFAANLVTDLQGNAYVCDACTSSGLIMWRFVTGPRARK